MRLFNYNLTTSLKDLGSFQFTHKHILKTGTHAYEQAHIYTLHGASKNKFRLKHKKPGRRGAWGNGPSRGGGGGDIAGSCYWCHTDDNEDGAYQFLISYCD